MGENSTAEKAPKKSGFDGIKTEFNKIIWPDQQSLVKRTAAVVAVSLVLGVIISVLDTVIKYGIDFLVK